MSHISYLGEMLKDVEAHWKPLGKVLNRTKGTNITAGRMKELHQDGAPIKIFAGGKTVAFLDYEAIPAKDINTKPSIIVKSRGVIEFEYYDKPFSHKNEMWSYHSKNQYINIKFVYYLLKINEPYFQGLGSKMQMPQIATPDTDKFQIPIPCPENPEKSLEIQTEIVRILDNFTDLTAEITAELTAELTARIKQYNYYRYQLLSFKEGEVEWKALREVSKVTIGEFVHKNIQDPSAPYPVYNGGIGPTGYYDKYNNTGEKILVSARGANAGFVNRLFTPYWSGNSCYSISVNDKTILNWHFVYYFLKCSESKLIGDQQKGGIPAVSKKQIEEFLIPIPPISEQIRIVSILDKFDALTNSITEGLPREIAFRQQQYRYYRELLLSFPRTEVEV